MNKYSVENTYEALRQKMLQYISTIYFGKNSVLRDACEDELREPLCLSQYPYIEANQAYLVRNHGLFSVADQVLPPHMKEFYRKMINAGLGVFENPYEHQIKAVESYYMGKDVMVATGTGSGKTECFMWPIAGKLYQEAAESSETWNMRGVRALMLYPMNALVSDQMGRLRKMIGDQRGEFKKIFDETGGRRPQFGMYTGRTAYAGEHTITEDRKLANTLEKNLIKCSAAAKKQLHKIGKYPAKENMEEFVSRLKNGEHYTSSNDAELLTRQEMQNQCPDILITNYSMLEYMLIRPMESSIWEATKVWLKANPDNKLLFIIDEAHMYRGSSGGEVSLLIRRLMDKLEINRNRIQFILTTASVSDDENGVQKFANDLSAQSDGNNVFEIVRGTPEVISLEGTQEFEAKSLLGLAVDDFVAEPIKKAEALRKFAKAISLPTDDVNFSDEVSTGIWLFDQLFQLAPVLRMLSCCRGKATKLEDLASVTFPNDSHEDAIYAVSVLLAVAPLAKSKNGSVLFPARLHLMFRGLRGLYACSNPKCNCKQHPDNNKLPFGHVFLSQKTETCSCGGKVYELMNDRACGALYFRGYIDSSEHGAKYIWSTKSVLPNKNLHEVHFFIIGEDENFKKSDIPEGKSVHFGWLDSYTGRLYEDDSQMNNPHCLHLAYCYSTEDKIWTFKHCPHCTEKLSGITDFATKGNEPFFNLVSEQLKNQPQTLFDEKDITRSPNRGRKVLLFSDSRQKAAVLARDLTRAADEDAMKKALTLAAKRLQEWALTEHKEPTMDMLYPFIVEIAATNGLRFFYGDDEGLLQNHIQVYKEEKECSDALDFPFDYEDFVNKIIPIPEQYKIQLLKQICSRFRSLSDVAFCWISPKSKSLMLTLIKLKKQEVDLSKEEYLSIFSAWIIDALTSSYAFGAESDEEPRNAAAGYDSYWGLKPGKEVKVKLKNIIQEKKNITEEQFEVLKNELLSVTVEVEGKRYINPTQVCLKFDPYPDKEWYICPKCGKISPFTLWNTCPRCMKREAIPKLMDDRDVSGLHFWRSPVIEALNPDSDTVLTGINAEEHTAQLSHKDELNEKMWSTTEDFEMRFQNVFVDDKNNKPVDVLSCTTTMEVGIDIGSLTAVGLRNIPPLRENYQQRAGRAGRRGSSVSSIVTYIDNGPHDNYYFQHPEEIISGEPRTPWIDNENEKIVYRHLNIISINSFLTSKGTSMDSVSVNEFFENYYADFCTYLENRQFSSQEIKRLVPPGLNACVLKYKPVLTGQLEHLKKQLQDFPERFIGENNTTDTLLDALYKEGIMPTYSFPKNVVGFYIEDPKKDKILEKPERSLDIAISEYAPGRSLVVNKKTYQSGGLYSYHAKKAAGKADNPARKYFNSSEYVKNLYLCLNESCKWFSTEPPKEGRCPFCGNKNIEVRQMVKPWGFAPLNGKSIRESQADNDRTYAEAPSYAATPNDQMSAVKNFAHIKIAKRADQQLLIVNKGMDSKGFTICKTCGAAIASDEPEELDQVGKPYAHALNFHKCHHDAVVAYLGTDVRTDMAVFEFSLDTTKISAYVNNENIWLLKAAVTLSEAMVLCAGRLLGIEFNEVKSGSRIRYGDGVTYLDVFLFDSLSSGAGYCAAVADRADELLQETMKLLNSCTCETSCHKCLNHFWNQRLQDHMDRHAALDVLNWCAFNKLADPIDANHCRLMALSLQELFKVEDDHEISIIEKNGEYYAVKDGQQRLIYLYPAMWNRQLPLIPSNSIAISDHEIKYALPTAYNRIVESFGKGVTTAKKKHPISDNSASVLITYQGGLHFSDESYSYIWNYVLDDLDEESDKAILKEIMQNTDAQKNYERPIYSPDEVRLHDNVGSHDAPIVLLWPESKVLLAFSATNDEKLLMNKTGWSSYVLGEIMDVQEFLGRIEVHNG